MPFLGAKLLLQEKTSASETGCGRDEFDMRLRRRCFGWLGSGVGGVAGGGSRRRWGRRSCDCRDSKDAIGVGSSSPNLEEESIAVVLPGPDQWIAVFGEDRRTTSMVAIPGGDNGGDGAPNFGAPVKLEPALPNLGLALLFLLSVCLPVQTTSFHPRLSFSLNSPLKSNQTQTPPIIHPSYWIPLEIGKAGQSEAALLPWRSHRKPRIGVRKAIRLFPRLLDMGMRNDGPRPQPLPLPAARTNGFLPTFRTISGYLKIASSGASSMASMVRSAGASVASSIADRGDEAGRDQSGFQVWDVEEAEDVRQLVSRHDGPVSFLQMQQKPLASKGSPDKFVDFRPLLIVVGDGAVHGSRSLFDQSGSTRSDSVPNSRDEKNGIIFPSVVRFYSFMSQSYVHTLKFRTTVYSVRCSPRAVVILVATQIDCFDAATLERDYTILTNHITGSIACGGIGYGPLAVGSRWLAYSGAPVAVLDTGRIIPQHLTSNTCLSSTAQSNGSLVAHYAKESSKQLAAGIANLGDMGYRKLSRYYSELLPERNNSLRAGSQSFKTNSTVDGHAVDTENSGMVVVRDIVSKSVVSQFRAHKSPIAALCFDPSGTLLVTASVQGHNINVFRIMSSLIGNSSGFDAAESCMHLYRLQRGLTNAVIQDISFSDDSQWIMISSSRGTSHLFALSHAGGTINLHNDADLTHGRNGLGPVMNGSSLPKFNQQILCVSGPPVTLSPVSRIKNGSNGWRGTVTVAAAAATGRVSSLSGAIASAFLDCKGGSGHTDRNSLRTKYHLLVFTPQGSVIQYVLRLSTGQDYQTDFSGLGAISYESAPDTDVRLVVEALQKWEICQRKTRREWEDNIDIYSSEDSGKLSSQGFKRGNSVYLAENGMVRNAKHEEKNHLYISEAELQMHKPHASLWMKSKIYFQVMMMNSEACNDLRLGGEVEIEKVPTRTIEARPRDLIPVNTAGSMSELPLNDDKERADNMNHVSHSSGVFAIESRRNGSVHHKHGQPEQNFSCQNNINLLDDMNESVSPLIAVLHDGIHDDGWSNLPALRASTRNVVHNRDSLKTEPQHEFVDNKESSKMEAQLGFVNSTESLKMEAYFMDDDNAVD
ncbi:hypothetical protein ACLOJK_029294 [Asimina triloba]